MIHEKMMLYAISLAENGAGKANPNPLVGAVIVKNNKIIGQGYHECYGSLHAERNALASITDSAEGASMYVSLEPCCHYGKTPPCTDAIIESGIKRVFVGVLDPNPMVSGKGVAILRQNGIEVVTGILSDDCHKQNEVFFHYIKNKTPFVVMKYAMTIDGKIATVSGESRWITGEPARKKVHEDRNRYSAIMVGVGTIIADDPMLNCRIDGGRNPIRIICDTNLRTPLKSQVVITAKKIPTILATSCTDYEKQRTFLELGVKILEVPYKGNHLDLSSLMIYLGEKIIDSVLLEGGSALNFAALQSGIVHKVQTYIAPKLFGGAAAKSPVGGVGFPQIPDCVILKNQKICRLGEDILIESEVENQCSRAL
jgi:diaminohydroxyphosphoribosylaminopyrimidine deaminase/5-amino-6-(5-phosphoribosylamino)uracil reductase